MRNRLDASLRIFAVIAAVTAFSACKIPGRTTSTDTTPATVTNAATIVFVGDVCFDWGLEKLVAAGFDPFSEEIKSIVRGADIALYNNEMTLGFRGEPEDKIAHFRCPPETLALVTNAGFDAASVANNHALDFGVVSLLDTLSNLDRYGILHSGGGTNVVHATEPVPFDLNGIRIALLCFGYMNPSNLIATGSRPGVAPLDLRIITNRIASAKLSNDFVVVSIHWGREYYDLPSADQIRFGQTMIDAGCGLIIGHHPHILQGIENYRGGTIFYSMGNFCFPQTDNTHLRDTLIGRATIVMVTAPGMQPIVTASCEVAPVYRNATNYAPELRFGEAGQTIIDKVVKISFGLTNDSPAVRFVAPANPANPFYTLE